MRPFLTSILLTLSFVLTPVNAAAPDDAHYLMFFSSFTRETTVVRFDGNAWAAIDTYNHTADHGDYDALLKGVYASDHETPKIELFRGATRTLLPLNFRVKAFRPTRGPIDGASLIIGLSNKTDLVVTLKSPPVAELYAAESGDAGGGSLLETLTWIEASGDELRQVFQSLIIPSERMSLHAMENCQTWLEGADVTGIGWRLLRRAR